SLSSGDGAIYRRALGDLVAWSQDEGTVCGPGFDLRGIDCHWVFVGGGAIEGNSSRVMGNAKELRLPRLPGFRDSILARGPGVPHSLGLNFGWMPTHRSGARRGVVQGGLTLSRRLPALVCCMWVPSRTPKTLLSARSLMRFSLGAAKAVANR